ncbi:MAG: LarC family nickel insertion protein, partial [Methanobacteriaceae archaeon]
MVVIIDPQNSGIAGNMVAGALIGCGASSKEVKEIMEIGSNDFGGVSVKINNINKNGIHSTFLNVIVENNGVNHSTHNFKDFLGKIDNINSDLFTKSIKECSKRVFNHIATAEAKVHGKTMNNIHFHEVGAADAVADVIGSVFAYYQLGFDKEKVYGLPVAVGGGSITTAHGRLPIPAPATVSILEGIKCFGGPINEELATPTGAALFKEFCNEFTDFIPMIKPRNIAYGAGKKDFSF